MNTRDFDITTMQSAARGFVGRVQVTKKFTYNAEDAFAALRIFMQCHTREFSGRGTQVLFIAVTPKGMLPEGTPPFSLLDAKPQITG
jgi:hypothetical protein